MSFIRSQKLLIRVLNWFGFLSISSESGEINQNIRIYSFLLNGLLAIYGLLTFGKGLRLHFKDGLSDIFSISEIIQSFLTQISLLLFAFYSMSKQKCIEQFFKKLDNIGSKLCVIQIRQNQLSNEFNLLKSLSIKSQACMTSLIIVASLMSFVPNLQQMTVRVSFIEYVFLYSSYMLADFYICSILIFIIFILKSFCCYLKIINEYLKHVTLLKCNEQAKLLIVEIIIDIKNLTQQFSKDFGILILYYYVFTYATATFEIFNYFNAFYQSKDSAITLVFFNSVWLSPLLIIVYFLGTTCARYEQLNKEISQNVQPFEELQRSPADRLFHQQSIEEETQIEAAGFMTVDGSILFKVSMSCAFFEQM